MLSAIRFEFGIGRMVRGGIFPRLCELPALVLLLASLLWGGARTAVAAVDFPEPASLVAAINFWAGVYSKVELEQGLVHDDRYLDLVYETIDLRSAGNSKEKRALERAALQRWRELLETLSEGPKSQTAEQRRVYALVTRAMGRPALPKDFIAAVERLRVQRGQRGRFVAGLKRAGRYEPRIREIFKAHGLPEDLAYLPHVESSFHARARSRAGAAGMWQFIAATGKKYLRVDDVVDERLDPFRAAEAAARLLKTNYSALRNWPLALTAYNHGRAGMLRARRVVGSDDLAQIIENYDGRRFGFASRNFYAQFLAARRIAQNSGTYVGELRRLRPQAVHELRLPFYLEASVASKVFGVHPKTLKALNLGLQPTVWEGHKRIPKGYLLRLPMDKATAAHVSQKHLLTRIPANARYRSQTNRGRIHVVRNGENLSTVAARHKVSPSQIVRLNKLPNADRIYPGQRLKLPTI